MPPTLSAALERGFRPFFLCAALWAVLAMAVWLAALHGGPPSIGVLAARDWHVHELLFGFVPAVIAGFLLTAVPNWTRSPPLHGLPLGTLVLLWLAGRIVLAWSAAPVAVCLVLGLAFPVALAALVWRAILSARAWRNVTVCLLLTVLLLADAGFLAQRLGLLESVVSFERLGMGAVAMLVALIGGRVTPAFTRNWMQSRGLAPLPAAFSSLDAAALGLLLVAVACWVAAPVHAVTMAAFALAAGVNAARLARWRGGAARAEPLLLVLHLGYGWLVLWTLLAAAAAGGQVPGTVAAHAFTTGVVGTMTLAIMTRASLGHGGRALTADRATVTVFVLVQAGALLRVLAPYMPMSYTTALTLAALLWGGAYLLFGVVYAPLLLGVARTAPRTRT